jgi:hypothetical protein
MKKLIATFILASLISTTSVPAQTEEDEIRLLIAGAPLAEAMSQAEGADGLVIWNWVKALSYTGHTNEALAAAAKIRRWMNEAETNRAIAVGLADAGKVDEAVSLLRRTKDSSGSRILIVEILTKAGRFSEALNEARMAKNASSGKNSVQRLRTPSTSTGDLRFGVGYGDRRPS